MGEERFLLVETTRTKPKSLTCSSGRFRNHLCGCKKTTGDGGRVIVWSDGSTDFAGSISAWGGEDSKWRFS